MRIPCFDMHCDASYVMELDGRALKRNGGQFDLERAAGLRLCQFFALYTPFDHPKNEMWPRMERMYECLKREIEASDGDERMLLCRTSADVVAAHEAGAHAALLSVESAPLLEDYTYSRLQALADMGVRLLSLTHNADNAFACGAFTQNDTGVTDSGRELIRRMNALGIILDVSHLSRASFYGALEHATLPPAASHSSADAVTPHPRNLTDEQFLMVKRAGGIVGVNLCEAFVKTGEQAEIDDVLRHIEHFLSLGGERTVGLGCDLDGCVLPRGMTGVESLPELYERMLRAGWREALVRDIFWGNGQSFINRTLT